MFTLLAGADLITWIMKNIDVEDQGLCGENLMIECFLCLNQGGGGGGGKYTKIFPNDINHILSLATIDLSCVVLQASE